MVLTHNSLLSVNIIEPVLNLMSVPCNECQRLLETMHICFFEHHYICLTYSRLNHSTEGEHSLYLNLHQQDIER